MRCLRGGVAAWLCGVCGVALGASVTVSSGGELLAALANCSTSIDVSLSGGALVSLDRTAALSGPECAATVDGSSAGAEAPAVVRSASGARLFAVDGGASLVLRNVSMTGCAEAEGDGGCVRAAGGGAVVLAACRATGNAARNGSGGVAHVQGARSSLAVVGGAYVANAAAAHGGAFAAAGGASLAVIGGARVEANVAGAGGGALAVVGGAAATIAEGAAFANSTTSGDGGAVFVGGAAASLAVADASFRGHGAARRGAVVYSEGRVNVSGGHFFGDNAAATDAFAYVAGTEAFVVTGGVFDCGAAWDGVAALCAGADVAWGVVGPGAGAALRVGGDWCLVPAWSRHGAGAFAVADGAASRGAGHGRLIHRRFNVLEKRLPREAHGTLWVRPERRSLVQK